MPLVLLVLLLLTISMAVGLFLAARLLHRRTGIPFQARVVYSDTGAWKRVERPLFSPRYGLTGKPDYIVEQRGARIPIEVKPNRTSPEPRDSDVMQLTAYALLMEEVDGAAPPYGLLKYRDVVFRIDMTGALRASLLELIDGIHLDAFEREVDRSHTEPRRCAGCAYQHQCGQALVEQAPG